MREVYHGRVQADGCLSIPARLRQVLRLRAGSRVLLIRDGDSARLMTCKADVQSAPRPVARFLSPDPDFQADLRAEQEQSIESPLDPNRMPPAAVSENNELDAPPPIRGE
jgi:bifunctional DNA-binding transcriptional regulator/antitoxin component of YhaV-PrlF toxin-antitoxin module